MKNVKFEVEYDFDSEELAIRKNESVETVYSFVKNRKDLLDCIKSYIGESCLKNKGIKTATTIKIGR